MAEAFDPFAGSLAFDPFAPTPAGAGEPEQDGALIRGVKRATNSGRTAWNLAVGDAATNADLAAERVAYEKANPGTPAGNELMAAWQRGDGVMGGMTEVAGEMKKDWDEAPTLRKSIEATGENLSAMGGGIVEQIPNSVAPLVGQGAGALIGSVLGPVGSKAGQWAGATVGNTMMESAEKVDQALRAANINPLDKAAVTSFLTENGDSILGKALTKGAIIGLVDTVTMGTGSALLRKPLSAATDRALQALGIDAADKVAIKAAESQIAAHIAADPAYAAANKGMRSFGRNATVAGLEPAGEFTGEYFGEGVSTGDWDTKNAALEALSSIGQSGITFAGQKAYDAMSRPFQNKGDPALTPTDGELDESNSAIDLPLNQYTDLPGAVPILEGPPDVIEVPTSTGSAQIRRGDGALSAAVVDTGVADALASGMPLPSMTKQQADAALANRPDAERLQIIPHPVSGSLGRYAIVEKPAQQLADLDAKSQAVAASQARDQQIQDEEDHRKSQAQTLKDHAMVEKRVVELNRAATSLESTIKDSTPPADAAVIREQAKDLRTQAKEIHDQLSEVKKDAAKPQQVAPQEVQADAAEEAQAELTPAPVQSMAEMPATQKVRDAARASAETRTAQVVDEEASVANPEPTPGQVAAGNYKKGHIKIGPLNIAIENPAGTIRKGIENGKKWATSMLAHYGYMKRTEGADGDQVDVYVKQGTTSNHSGSVFVVDQFNPRTGAFDEHKAMIGFASQAEAQAAYDAHFSDKSGPKRRRAITEMTPAAFKTWAEKGDTTQPVVQADEAQAEIAQSTGAKFARKRGESTDDYQRRMAEEKNAKKRNRFAPAADTVAADLKEATGVDGTLVEISTLPNASDASANQLSRQAAEFMAKIAKMFGKQLVIVDDLAEGDGLYVRGNTIYVSTNSTVAHLRILGHEMLHALKNQAPKAYAAMLKAVQSILTDSQLRGQVRDYLTDKKDWTDAQIDAWLKQDGNKDTITEEWMADLSGNRWAESSFWESVFAKIGEQHSSATAKGIIAQLKMAITNALNKLMAAIKGNAFAVDARVAEHLDEIREAFAEGFADYAKAVKDNQAVDHDAARARFAKKTIDATVASEQEGERVKKFGFAVRGGVISGAPPFVHKVIDIKKQVKQAVVDAMSDRAHPEDAVWYREAGRAIREYSHGDKALQEKLTRLVAKLSQGAGVNSNVTSVIKAAYQIANGETPAVGRFPNAFRKDFAPLMDAPIFDNTLKGIDSKLQNFYRNLHDETFQENNWPDAAVIDRHAIGYIWHEKGKTTVDSDAQYTYAEQIMQKATAEYNQINGTKLKPRDMQAMLWGWWKRMDAAAEAKEAGEEYKASGTAWNYPQFFERATANITAEVLPSTQVSGLDLKLTQAEKAQFQKEALDLIFDAEGINELARRAGLSLYTSAESTGGYDNKTNPNLVTGAIAAKIAMESGSGDPYHRYTYDAVDRYALAWQYIFKQDGVPWFRADRTIDPAELDRVRASREARKAKGQKVSAKGEPPLMAQGFYLVFDRDLTAAEETEVFSGLQQDVSKTVGYTKVKPNAIAVINYRGDDGKPFMMSDEDFKAALQHFAKLGGVTALESFAAESRYHYYDFHEDQTGEGLLSRGEIQSGQRDLSGWISGRREAFDALVTRWERAKLSTKRSDAAGDGRYGGLAAQGSGEVRGYGTSQPGSVTVQGTHYSQQERANLDGRYYGTGMRGAEGPRVRAATDPRLKERVYFYADKGTGVRPEDGVGAIAHTAQLNNVYDGNADTWVQAKVDRALTGDAWMNAFESAVIDNGFDGYVSDFGTQRAAVLLGRHNVPVTRGQGGVSETKKTETPVTDRVAADRKLPAGRMTGAEWKQQIPEATMLEDDKSYYKDDVVGQLRRAKFSFKRAAEFWTKAAENEGLFQFPKSSQTEFDAIMRDIEPRLAVTEKGVFDNKMSKRFVVRMTDGKTADVFVGKDKTMWVNASQLKAGQSGGLQLYAGMLNYAHNNGYVLKGDPLGVTVMATFRRTENMLASALKFGTTRHMNPSDSQRNPATAGGFTLGVKEKLAPLAWEEGKDDTNLESLLNVSYTNITNLVPEMKDVVYDFAGDSYQWAGTDRVVTREEWATLSRHLGLALAGRERSDPGMPAPIMAGEPGATARSSTLKRVAITAAVLRQEGGALGGDLLDQVGGELQRDGLSGVSYSTKRLAPNGKPSNLDEKQYAQVRTPAFKAWFGDWEHAAANGGVWANDNVSKVVDENGEPMVVYHGAEAGGFTKLDPAKGDKHRSPMIFAAATRNTARTYSGSGDEIDLSTESDGLRVVEEDGEYYVENKNGGIESSFYRTEADAYDALSDLKDEYGDPADQMGIYSLFLNIRNPNEAHFEGANWDGQRLEPIYELLQDGEYTGEIVSTLEEAEQAIEEGRADEYQESDDLFNTTNSVAEEALRLKNDGAIIRQVVDDGGQGGVADADDVFVIFDSNQAKSATQNRGTFSKIDNDLRYSTKRFYSQLERQVEAAPDKVFGSAKQVSNWLVANAGKLGIKQDEIQWTGITDWLAMQQRVSKSDVLGYLAQNGVQVEEVEKGGKNFDEDDMTIADLPEGWMVVETEGDVDTYGTPARRNAFAVIDNHGRPAGFDHTEEGAVMDAYASHPEPFGKGSTKYGQYVLPGGTNYKELLLTLPEKHVYPTTPVLTAEENRRFSELTQKMRRDGNLPAAEMADWKALKHQRDKHNNELEDLSRAGQNKEPFRSGHWREENILAHVRFNDRTDADGNKVLFIEELQSDWGQTGRDNGFGEVSGYRVVEPNGQLFGEYRSKVDAESALSRAKPGSVMEKSDQTYTGVPAGPFVQDTKSWLSLGLKRMIAYAVENGYDKVAFVNGEQSADRYSLTKKIESVGYKDGKLEAYDTKRMKVLDKEVSESELPDYLGQEVADRLLAQPKQGGWQLLDGESLKVGGEGMKTFYDKIVPQTINDVLKKLGGGKVEMVRFNDFESKTGADDDKLLAELGVEAEGTRPAGQPGFTITPALHASVSQGMPLFSLKRRINDTLTKVDHAVDGLSNMPNQFDYLKDRYLALGKIARVDEISKEIRQSLNKASDADKKAIYTYLTTRGATVGRISDPAVRLISKRIKDTIEYTGDQLVARGLLDQQARDHYRDQYLPRMYLRHLLDDNSAKIIGMGKKPSDLGYLKHRKDIPVEIRELVLGEVKDPSFLSVNAIGRAMRDISLMDWMGKISQNNDWVFPEIFTQWNGRRVTAYWLRAEADRIERQAEHYDATNKPLALAKVAQMRTQANTTLGNMSAVDHKKYKQIPDTMRYGLLRGMYVRTEIFNDIMGASQVVNADPTWFEDWFGFGGKGTKLTQWWKFTKVALNPPGQIRNFVSNMVMLQLSGVGLHKLPFRLIEAVRDISNNGPYWKIAKKYGVTESTFTAQELFRVKRDLSDLEAKMGKVNPLRFLMAAGASFLEKVSDLYQFSEALGKTIKIIDEMKNGKSEAEAAIEAQKWLFDYSLVPQSVRLARNAPIGMPFLTYQIKVLPRLLEVAAKYPWRFLPWVGLMYGMQAAVASMFGVDDDELKKLKKSLPEWLQDRSHTVFMPMRDADGRLQVADVGYFFPWTFYSQIGMHAADGKIKKALVDDIGGMFSAPIIGAGAALMSNYDTFTHKPIYNESDPTGYQAAAIANYAYDLMAPPFLSSHGVVSPMGLADKKFGGKLVQALGNTTNKFGDPKATEEQAIGALVGFNFYGMDPEHTRLVNMQVMNGKVRDAERALRARLMDRGLSDEERGTVMRNYQAKMMDLQKEMVEYAKESEVPQQLRVLKRQ